MNKINGDGVKYIDGIYRQPKKMANPIQVELPLDTVTTVPVKWRTSKPDVQSMQSQQEDKFYSLAVAAFSGVKPRQKLQFRLHRKNSNELTIAQATKRAKELEKNIEETQPTTSPFIPELATAKPKVQKIPKAHRTARVLRNGTRGIKSIFGKMKASLGRAKSHVVSPRTSLRSIVLAQGFIIITLALCLVTSLYSYGQYKQKMTTTLRTERQQSDAQWQELKASWQCISNKWEQMQTNPSINSQTQGDVTC